MPFMEIDHSTVKKKKHQKANASSKCFSLSQTAFELEQNQTKVKVFDWQRL